ncbi:MAG TPA: alpha-galactosidase [Bacteroidales bacterium]|nr:alpha-galactosidase [Bacteroidales bacterium]
MKKLFIPLIISCLVFQSNAQQGSGQPELIKIETKNTALIFKVDQKSKIQQLYFGESISNDGYNNMLMVNADIYPGFGTSYVNEPALRVVHADGNTSSELVYRSHSTKIIADGIQQTTIHASDTFYPFSVDLCFKAYLNEDIIEQWVEISHREKKDVTLFNYASSHLYFSNPAYYLTQFYGNWANEMNMKEVELTRGQKVLDSKLGVRSDQFAHPCFLLSLGEPSNENSGEVIGGTLAWPGSWNLTFDVDHLNDLHIISGVNSFAGQYRLKPGELLKTPALFFSYSEEGTGKITRSFHQWAKKYGIYKGDRLRTTLLNNWEATYFNFNEEVLSGIIKDASEMGFELFLLDDGWFGNKYPRNNDNAGLGDWEVNRKKLPNGLGYLVEESKKQKIKFGIWLEPEMVNPQSELYENHPDWVIGQPNRALDLSRNQLILDLSNPKVQEYVYGIIDRTLTETPGIAYVKWDCNRFVTNCGSYYLSPETQSHLWIEYTRGLFSVLDKVRSKYKDISLMVCSGGGGRIDYGTLPYFDEFWISDNTDALDRIFIQWGTTYFFPAMALASHVSVVPNHITGRITPLKFRFDVAMSAKLGMDLQPKDLSGKDKEFCRNAIQAYYSIREIVQFGDLYRLLSPYTNTRTAMMYVDQDQKEAVVFSYLLKKTIFGNNQPLILRGLDEHKLYRLSEVNKDPDNYSWFTELEGKVFSGEYLMKYGIRFTMYNEFDSKIIRLTAQ